MKVGGSFNSLMKLPLIHGNLTGQDPPTNAAPCPKKEGLLKEIVDNHWLRSPWDSWFMMGLLPSTRWFWLVEVSCCLPKWSNESPQDLQPIFESDGKFLTKHIIYIYVLDTKILSNMNICCIYIQTSLEVDCLGTSPVTHLLWGYLCNHFGSGARLSSHMSSDELGRLLMLSYTLTVEMLGWFGIRSFI